MAVAADDQVVVQSEGERAAALLTFCATAMSALDGPGSREGWWCGITILADGSGGIAGDPLDPMAASYALATRGDGRC